MSALCQKRTFCAAAGTGVIRLPRRRAPPCVKMRHGPSARWYLLNRLAVDFENFDRSTGTFIIKDADCQPPSVPRKRIKVGSVLPEDRPMCMLMMPVNDVTLAVTAVIIVWIDFPNNVF